MSSDATPQDVLREAARILMRDGWTQGVTHDDLGNHCAMGAISVAAKMPGGYHHGEWAQALTRFTRWLTTEYGISGTEAVLTGLDPIAMWNDLDPIAMWNDAPERTAEDVILALKRAAEES